MAINRTVPFFLALGLAAAPPAFSQELPIPSSKNATIVSLEHSPADAAEVDYIKNNFNFGLYAWLSFSVTTLTLALDWHAPLDDADNGIQVFKNEAAAYLEAAKLKNVRLHLVLVAGLCRNPAIYKEAMEEDVRNCQWYNDNKIVGDDEFDKSGVAVPHVFGTLSRYARKLRANFEAKARAGLSFLRREMADNPGHLAAVSGWGESELNFHRIDDLKSVQEHFCDYSPFAVLEFRDWILHAGEYDDLDGAYKGQGFAQGGARYQGTEGLGRFNADFGTNFTTWDLLYYHWSLDDDYDLNPVDTVNNDPHKIPFASYSQENMKPASGANYRVGGFDPPRTMAPGNKWWDLWNLFRETMVANYVRDAAVWAAEAGIPSDRWFSHQVPADYLFGTNPAMPNKNARYYASASPMWTADIRPLGAPGATIYDVKFPDWWARTTDTALPAMAALGPLWAIMEYDPETYPPGFTVAESSPDFILGQYMRVYDAGPFLINFWRWIDEGDHRIKGKNKEIALRNFIQRIRDKARSKDLGVVFTPPKVVGFRGEFQAAGPAVELRLTGKIWEGHPWEWQQWGDFSRFEVYKGTTPGFPADPAHLLGTTRDYFFRDTAVAAGQDLYYKVRALNVNNAAGPFSAEIKLPGFGLVLTAGVGGTTDPAPGTHMYEPGTVVEVRAIAASQYLFSRWTGDISGPANPIQVTLDSAKSVAANFVRGGVFPPIDFSGEKAVNRSLTQEEIILTLKWKAEPRNLTIVKYRIYLVEGNSRRLLTELDPTATEYRRRGLAKDKASVFGITAVNADGLESAMASVTVQ